MQSLTPQYLLNILVLSTYVIYGYCGEIQDLTLHPGHLKRYASHGEMKMIDEISEFPTPSDFFRDYVSKSYAVVMRGVVKDTKPFKDWTDEYILNMSIPADDRIKIQGDKGPLHLIKRHLHEFIRTYNKTNEYLESEVPTYLGREVPLSPVLNCPEIHKIFDYTNLWYSKGGTKSPVHTDGADNLLCVYAGEKEVSLLHPDQYLNKDGVDPRAVAISYMDVDRVDYTKHPDLAKIEYYYKANLSAGDCLYLPYNWIHQVFSYNRNIAINIWWHHPNDVTDIVQKCANITPENLTIADKLRPRPSEGFLPKSQIDFFFDDMTRTVPAKLEDLEINLLDLLIVGQYYTKIFREPGEGANTVNVGKYSEGYMDRVRNQQEIRSQYNNKVFPIVKELDFDNDRLITHDEVYRDISQKTIMPSLYKEARSVEKTILKYMRIWTNAFTAKQNDKIEKPKVAVDSATQHSEL